MSNKHLLIYKFFRKANNLIVKIIPEKAWAYKALVKFGLKITIKRRLKPRSILRIEVPLADHCNLNCYMCANYSPIAEEWFCNIDTFKNDFKQIAMLSNNQLEEVFFHGGEPLLHPNVTKFLDVAREYFPETKIAILTNGVLLLKQPRDFWLNCKKNNVELKITRYPITLDLEKIRQIAQEYGVLVYYFGGDDAPIKNFWKLPLDIDGKQEIRKSHTLCHSPNHCINLRDGKLFPCTRIAFIHHFNRYFNKNLTITEKDYIDIYKVSALSEIINFLCHPIPFCRYCANQKFGTGITWQISKKDISEWT